MLDLPITNIRSRALTLVSRIRYYQHLASTHRSNYSSFIYTYSRQLASLHNLYPEYFV